MHRRDSIIQRISLALYSLLTFLLIPLLIAQLLTRSLTRFKAYRHRIIERFGYTPIPPQTGGILVHCVSVGEVVVACKLIDKLLSQQPNLVITVTTTTPTGSERLTQLMANRVHHCYLPYDIRPCMSRLLKIIQPSQVLVTEVELWPNFVDLCWRRDIPISIVNARMTERSASRYQRVSWIFQPMLSKLSNICAQSQRDYDQYQKLGAPPHTLTLSHNIKFDIAEDNIVPLAPQLLPLKQWLSETPRPVFIAASTHDPEENVVLKAYDLLSKTFPNLLLILAPRHPQRFEKVSQMLSSYAFIRLSRVTEQSAIPEGTNVVYGDTLGQLNTLYNFADFAFIGGSIADKGGHNPLEASVKGIPCMMGHSIYNNPYICETLAQGNALQWVTSSDDIVTCAKEWLITPQKRQQQGQAGINIIAKNRGAIDNTLKRLGLVS